MPLLSSPVAYPASSSPPPILEKRRRSHHSDILPETKRRLLGTVDGTSIGPPEFCKPTSASPRLALEEIGTNGPCYLETQGPFC